MAKKKEEIEDKKEIVTEKKELKNKYILLKNVEIRGIGKFQAGEVPEKIYLKILLVNRGLKYLFKIESI